MEKHIILGYQGYSGDFEGRPYSGIKVYVQRGDVTPEAGIAVDVFKFKSALLAKLPIAFTPDVVGCVLEIGYDRYGNINHAQITGAQTKV